MIRIETVPASVVWPIRLQVMYPGEPFDSIKLPDDDSGLHLGLYEGEELICVISLFRRGDALQFRKFATRNAYQGQGYGSALLKYVMDYAKAQNIRRVWCNARQSAATFYKRFGMKETPEGYTKGGINYLIMEWKADLQQNEPGTAAGR